MTIARRCEGSTKDFKHQVMVGRTKNKAAIQQNVKITIKGCIYAAHGTFFLVGFMVNPSRRPRLCSSP
ncbi:hypothetical protein KCP77_07545 [Salmonella enterica subsp. enterica]|nr:hypothetical protein KCP77_07545 [Salmonella enterica subsp. enterica]